MRDEIIKPYDFLLQSFSSSNVRRIFSFYFTEEETLLSFAHPIMIPMMLKVNKPGRSLQPGGVSLMWSLTRARHPTVENT